MTIYGANQVFDHLNITNPDIRPGLPDTIGNRKDWHATECGTFHLSSSDHVKFYSALVWKNGGWLHLYDGAGRMFASFPTLFTGSFVLEGGVFGGLYVKIGAANGIVPAVTVSFMDDNG
jgi:hypothetical protein